MIDDVQSYVAAAEVLKERGANKIYVLATHGLLSSDAPRLIEESPIDEVMSSYTFNFSKVESYIDITFTVTKFLYFGFLYFSQVVVTNTVPHDVQKMQCPKIKTVDISILLAEAIRRIHNKESMSYLFKNVTLED